MSSDTRRAYCVWLDGYSPRFAMEAKPILANPIMRRRRRVRSPMLVGLMTTAAAEQCAEISWWMIAMPPRGVRFTTPGQTGVELGRGGVLAADPRNEACLSE